MTIEASKPCTRAAELVDMAEHPPKRRDMDLDVAKGMLVVMMIVYPRRSQRFVPRHPAHKERGGNRERHPNCYRPRAPAIRFRTGA